MPRLSQLARIIHEHFCCNRRSAAATSLRSAGSPPRTIDVLHEYASGPPGSALATRLRDFATHRHESCGLIHEWSHLQGLFQEAIPCKPL